MRVSGGARQFLSSVELRGAKSFKFLYWFFRDSPNVRRRQLDGLNPLLVD